MRARASSRAWPLKSTKPVMPHTVLTELLDDCRRVSANQNPARHLPGDHRARTDDAITADVRHEDGALAHTRTRADAYSLVPCAGHQISCVIHMLPLSAGHADPAAYHRFSAD